MSKKKKKNNWGLPSNAADFFDPHYDDPFRAEHPVLFWLTVAAIVVCVMTGPAIYLFFCAGIQSTFNENFFELIVCIIGFLCSFGISIAVCNLFLIVHKQYLGHYVTLCSSAIGICGSAIALFFLWLM